MERHSRRRRDAIRGSRAGNIFAIAQLDMQQKKLRLPNGSVVVMTPCAVEIAGASVGGKALMLREPVRRDRIVTSVWKSTRASGAPDDSSLSHISAMTRPCWLHRAVRNRRRHAIDQSSRRRSRSSRPARSAASS
jgi:hypothetical protein